MKIAINYLKVRLEELKHDKRITIKNQKNLIKLYTDSIASMTKAIKHLKQAGQKCDHINHKNGEIIFKFCNDFKFCPYCGREIEEVKK